MWRSFTSWFANLPWRPLVTLLATGVLTWILTRILDAGIEDKATRDAFIGGVCVLAILGFFAALIFSPWMRGQTAAQPSGITAQQMEDRLQAFELEMAEQQTLSAVVQPPAPPPTTGETLVGNVTTRIRTTHIPGWIDPPDYVVEGGVTEYISGMTDINTLLTLKLGEMALLRRLNVAPDQRQPSRRCVAVLQASGIATAEPSIAKLEDLKLIDAAAQDTLCLTNRGRRFVYLSNQALVHDEGLVAAYRQVTPTINTTVRFDGH